MRSMTFVVVAATLVSLAAMAHADDEGVRLQFDPIDAPVDDRSGWQTASRTSFSERPSLSFDMSKALQETASSDGTTGGSAEVWAAPTRTERMLNDSGWTVDLILYLWLPFIVDGDSTVGPVTAPLDLTISDVFDLFTPFGLMGRVEVWKDNRFGFIFDGMYVRLESIDLIPPIGGAINLNIEQAMLDFLVAWRAINTQLGEGDFPRLVFDVIGGARVQYLKQTVTFPLLPDLGGSEWWVEPVIGGRIVLPLSPHWLINIRGDVSGFGIGNASDLTWNFLAGVGWSVNDWFTLQLGYRFLGIDYSSGSGLSALGIDVTMHGPWLGFQFTF